MMNRMVGPQTSRRNRSTSRRRGMFARRIPVYLATVLLVSSFVVSSLSLLLPSQANTAQAQSIGNIDDIFSGGLSSYTTRDSCEGSGNVWTDPTPPSLVGTCTNGDGINRLVNTKEICESLGYVWYQAYIPVDGVDQPDPYCVTSIGGAVISSNPVFEGISQSTINEVASYIYFMSYRACLASHSWNMGSIFGTTGAITEADVASGNIIDGHLVSVSAFMVPVLAEYGVDVRDDEHGGGAVKCPDLTIPMLSLWGFTSIEEFLCSMGFTRANYPGQCGSNTELPNGGTWKALSSGSVNATTFENMVYNRVYNGNTQIVNLSPPYLEYRYTLETFKNTCIAGSSPISEDLITTAISNSEFATKGYAIYQMDVGQTTLPEEKTYYVGSGNYSNAVSDWQEFLHDHEVLGINLTPRDDKGDIERHPGYTCVGLQDRINELSVEYALWALDHEEQAIAGLTVSKNLLSPGSAGDTTSTCAIPGIGWIVCPVLNFLTGISDWAYNAIDSLLDTDNSEFSQTSGTYTAWQIMRNFANVGFVIAFLVIIFSQITNIGLQNYGIKKLLPRLIITVILVNISFYIAQLAIDISNILGASLKDLFDNLAVYDSSTLDGLASGSKTSPLTWLGTVLMTVTGGAALLGGTALAIYGGPTLLIPIVLAALWATVVTLFILVARQSLVILLVVVAPIAFLAVLLPNTNKLFTQWRKYLVGMLMVYPMISLVYGASKFASAIILSSVDTLGSVDTLKIVAGVGAQIIPLALTPMLLKNSLKAIPAIGNIATKFANRANSLVGKTAKKQYAKSNVADFMAYRKSESEKKRALMKGGQLGENKTRMDKLLRRKQASERNAKYNQGRGLIGRGLKSMSPKYGEYAEGRGLAIAGEIAAKETKEAKDRITEFAQRHSKVEYTDRTGRTYQPGVQAVQHYVEDQLHSAMQEGDSTKTQAAADVLIGQGQRGITAAVRIIGRNKNSEAVQDLQTHIKSAWPAMKTEDQRLNAFADGDRDALDADTEYDFLADGSIDPHSIVRTAAAPSTHFAALPDELKAKQTVSSILSSDLTPALATQIMANPDIFRTMKNEQKAAFVAMGGTLPPGATINGTPLAGQPAPQQQGQGGQGQVAPAPLPMGVAGGFAVAQQPNGIFVVQHPARRANPVNPQQPQPPVPPPTPQPPVPPPTP